MREPPRPFTAEEDAAIVVQWSRGPLVHIAADLARSESAVRRRARRLVREGRLRNAERFRPRWDGEATDALLEGLGEVSLTELARRLRRSRAAINLKRQQLGVTQTDNWLTLAATARILGMTERRVRQLIAQRMLAGRRSAVCYGPRPTWRIEVDALTRFVRRYPEQYNRRRISTEPWLTLARQVYRADPLLRPEQAAREAGCALSTLRRHLLRGWLPGVRVVDRGPHGRWLIRRSQLAAYRNRRGQHAVTQVEKEGMERGAGTPTGID